LKNVFTHYASFIIIIPLVLSGFTHLWNPIGFPTFHVDEGHYMRRAMQVIRGLGPQEPTSSYVFAYDHPYFGQLFLAGVLKMIGYPDSLSANGDIHSIEKLYLAPRLLMGLLAVIDTLLIFKIAQRMFNRNVALMASILFAVMPLSWMTRGIFLDSILLPFLLSSILFALHTERTKSSENDTKYYNKNIMILTSGVFLGLAIFTKAPIFTMIPLVAVIILKNNRHDFKRAAVIWLAPVILIPFLWPSYALVTGHLGEWINGVLYQTERQTQNTLFHSVSLIFKIDPVMLVIGFAGFGYALVKKKYLLALWVIPYLIFLYSIGWVTHFFWIVLLPPLCISAAVVLEDISVRLRRKNRVNLTRLGIISAFGLFGLTMTMSLISLNLNSSYLEVYAFVVNEIKSHSLANGIHAGNIYNSYEHGSNETFTLIGSQRIKALTWIPQYVLGNDFFFRDTDNPKDNFTTPIKLNDRLLFVADSSIRFKLALYPHGSTKDNAISNFYYETGPVATFLNMQYNNYDFINTQANHGLGRFIEIRSNY
jgi:hypothetical protein